jgi:hypothetical protein
MKMILSKDLRPGDLIARNYTSCIFDLILRVEIREDTVYIVSLRTLDNASYIENLHWYHLIPISVLSRSKANL